MVRLVAASKYDRQRPPAVCVASWTCTATLALASRTAADEAGNPSTDDVDVFLHQTKAWRSRMAIRASLLRRTGARGACESPRHQQFQDRAIISRHDFGGTHHPPRVSAT